MSDPHAARMQHPPQHHREVLRRSSGAARKDSCTACERTAFTPCRRTHSAAYTRRRWREEPTSTWPHRRQARRTRCTLAPSTPPPAPARAASTMVKGPHHTTHSGSAPPSLRTHSSSSHPDAAWHTDAMRLVTVPLLPFEYGTNGVNGPNFKGENKV